MNNLTGLDWSDYFHGLSDDETRELAVWLATERLAVGEFMEIVDRVYARSPVEWRGQSPVFVSWFGRPGASEYARRKRRFAELVSALEEAHMTGALPGDVVPDELELFPPLWTEAPSIAEVLEELECARRGSI